jgi:hypothetical protein
MQEIRNSVRALRIHSVPPPRAELSCQKESEDRITPPALQEQYSE